jgi:hypothetical protein
VQAFDFLEADFAILIVFEFFLMTRVSAVSLPIASTARPFRVTDDEISALYGRE